MSDYVKAYVSTEQSSPCQDARFSRAHGDQERASGAEEASREGAQTPHAVALLTVALASPKATHLRNSGEFRQVYAEGKRYHGRLMTAFVSPNGLAHHRLGITASRKATGNAVERNRSKRLLRESFRLSESVLNGLRGKYDWVLNAKHSLLSVKVALPLKEFQEIISRVANDEHDGV